MCASKTHQAQEKVDDENEIESMSRTVHEGDAETVRRLLDQGVIPTDDDVREADWGQFPEVTKILIEDGYIDVNDDWELAGDLLCNMVWEQRVSRNSVAQ